jgi:hypothetical protein
MLFNPSTILDMFLGVKTTEDLALTLLRLGTRTLNEKLDKTERTAFAAESYYIAFRWFEHGLSKLLKDVEQLPLFWSYYETRELKTLNGRHSALEGALNILQMGQWAWTRMSEGDKRIKDVRSRMDYLKKRVSRYYENEVMRDPPWYQVIDHGDRLSKLAAAIHDGGQPMAVNDLNIMLLMVAHKNRLGALIADKKTRYRLKNSNECLTLGDFSDLLTQLYFDRMTFYEEVLKPSYENAYNDFITLYDNQDEIRKNREVVFNLFNDSHRLMGSVSSIEASEESVFPYWSEH